MVTTEDIDKVLKPHINRVLLYVQAGVTTPHQFEACRKLILDELGKSGLTRELEKLCCKER
jgi:hypothetical protein